MTTSVDDVWPTELRVKDDGRLLAVAFEDGTRAELPAEYLRVESPSAEVQGHAPEERRTVPGKRDVNIAGNDNRVEGPPHGRPALGLRPGLEL